MMTSIVNTERVEGSAKAKLVFFGNDFPGDDLQEVFRRLHRHSKDRRFRYLSLFLDDSTVVIKEELANLPQSLQNHAPHFDTISTLAHHVNDLRTRPLGAALGGSLLCVLQLGMFIGHHESLDLRYNVVGDQTVLSGLSVGLLAAATVALSTGLADLITTGAESVRAAFRLGVRVNHISELLESSQAHGSPQSWAHVVAGMDAEAIQGELEAYNMESGTTDLTQAFISAADKSSVSISGPPSRVQAAFQHSSALRLAKSLPLPVYDGLCHSSHVYDHEDVEAVVGGLETRMDPSLPVQLNVLSSQTGLPFQAKRADALFDEICTELLSGKIYLENIIDGILTFLSQSPASECQFHALPASLVSDKIAKAVQRDLPLELIQEDVADWTTKDFGERQPGSYKDSKLAIVGMACRMPGGANDPELFWQLLEEGRDVHTTVPIDRFDIDTHYNATGKTENTTQTRFGSFMDKPGYFDAGFFNMSPRDAEQTDPMHRLALVTAYEALEMSGYAPNRTPSTRLSRTGVFYGQASDDWRELNASQNIGTYAVPGGERAFANGRINYFFKFSGPSFNIDTACSSGMAAVHAACSALWAGEADTVVAGGLNIITDPDNYAGLCNAHFLSKTGQCKVWDKDADGYCRADGVGSLVIKRLEDAEADNDTVLAVVLSAATNHPADAISITHPHVGAQKDNYTQVLQNAGVNPLDVSYVELHGTGTQAGDAVESESVSQVFAPLVPRRRANQRLHLGAVKSNIGHSGASAGIASLIKALLVFQKNVIPAHIGIKTEINPTIPQDLEKRNVGLAMENTPWPRPSGQKRLAVVNSFGAHGGNTTVLLEDAPQRQRVTSDSHSTHVVTISAKSEKSLRGNLQNMLSYLENCPDTDLGDLSYTTCARRMHHKLRVATTVSSSRQLQKFLRVSIMELGDIQPISKEAPPVIFTYTGQGAYYRGIGQQLFEQYPTFHEQILDLDRLVRKLGFHSVLPVIDGTIDASPSPLLGQLSVVVVEIALTRFWLQLGIKPAAVIGHSLGEYAAFVAAGVLSAADALFLVGKRAQKVSDTCEASSHAMLSVRASQADIARIAAGYRSVYEVSCINGHEDTVISGGRDGIDTIRRALEQQGVKCALLEVPYAFHSSQMDPMLDDFKQDAAHIPFKAPLIPVISPLLRKFVFGWAGIDARYLRHATRKTVDFVSAIEAAQTPELAGAVWLEIGPHPICTPLIRNILPCARVASSCRRNEENITTVAKSLTTLHLAGIPVCWGEFFKPDEKTRRLLQLPKYDWDEKNYWIPYKGTWTLDKAHPKHGNAKPVSHEVVSGNMTLRTALIHQVVSHEMTATTARLQTLSNMQDPVFLRAVDGHRINGYGVASNSIWADMALTVGEYIYRQNNPTANEVHMNLADMSILHAQVAHTSPNDGQFITLIANHQRDTDSVSLSWHTASSIGDITSAPFATATIRFESAATWSRTWSRTAHLITGRIAALSAMAAAGEASHLSKDLAYALFRNVVEYGTPYRGMDGVLLAGLEAAAEVTLPAAEDWVGHTPPHWIDAVAHLSRLVMNAADVAGCVYTTPGCESFRLAQRLVAGGKYRSYVRMIPAEEKGVYVGDVYILQDEEIIGVVEGQIFKRLPRVLLGTFFSPPGKGAASSLGEQLPDAPYVVAAGSEEEVRLQVQPPLKMLTDRSPTSTPKPAQLPPRTPEDRWPSFWEKKEAAAAPTDSDAVCKCMAVLARETGLDMVALRDEASLWELGVDSLMSLVLSEKFRSELGLEVKSSIFLTYPTFGELKGWIGQNC